MNKKNLINLIFLGSFYPPKVLKTIKKDTNGKVGFSNHNFEMSIIKGLMKHEDVNLKILTSPEVFSYPHNNKTFYTKAEEYNIKDTPVKSVGFINLFILNKIWSSVSILISLFVLIWSYKSKKVYILLNTSSLYLELPVFLCSLFWREKISKTLIVPDVPEQLLLMNQGHGRGLKSKILSLLNRAANRLACSFDNYVLLTEAMKDYFKVGLNYIVMEGVLDIDKDDTENYSNDNEINSPLIILYTGTLKRIFGIMNLVEAFERGKFINAELWICGSGEMEDNIKKCAQKNPNIKYLGLLNVAEVRELQRKATILVNPRTSMGEYTKYSFPSKTIEYLLTGRAVVMNRLPGVPEEYFNYVFCPKDETIHSLTDKLAEILSMDRNALYKHTRLGREFILRSKNSVVQTRRILNLMTKTIDIEK